jgi:hypothetical protein
MPGLLFTCFTSTKVQKLTQQGQEEEAPAVVALIRVLRSHRRRKSSILERMEGTTEIETAAAQ